MGMEMNISDWLDVNLGKSTQSQIFFIGETKIGLVMRSKVFLNDLDQFEIKHGGVYTLLQEDIGIEAGPEPFLTDTLIEGQERTDKIEMKMGISWDILGHSRDEEVCILTHTESFSDWVFIAEIFLSHRLGDDQCAWSIECGFGIAGKERNSEDFEDVCIGKDHTTFVEAFILVAEKSLAVVADACRMEDFWKFIEQCLRQWSGTHGGKIFFAASLVMYYDSVNPIDIYVVTIEAELVHNPEQNEECAGHPDGQTGDVDDSVDLLLAQDMEGDRQVAFKHFSLSFYPTFPILISKKYANKFS